ncbi:hypothetical protein Hdeb2414_s0012g00377111 [Helianthus debilis subsp. tardiflorus]
MPDPSTASAQAKTRNRMLTTAINRGVWLTSKASLGKSPLSHFATTPPPLQHPHPPPSSIIHLRVCVVVSRSKIDSKSSCQSKAMFG